MKRIAGILLGAALLLNGCISEEASKTVDCSRCYRNWPLEEEVKLKITVNEANKQVPLVIFRDNIDEGFVEFRDTATENAHYIWLATEQAYAVQATYHKNNRIIYAVDGCELEVEKITSECDSTCWFIRDKELDLRLEY